MKDPGSEVARMPLEYDGKMKAVLSRLEGLQVRFEATASKLSGDTISLKAAEE